MLHGSLHPAVPHPTGQAHPEAWHWLLPGASPRTGQDNLLLLQALLSCLPLREAQGGSPAVMRTASVATCPTPLDDVWFTRTPAELLAAEVCNTRTAAETPQSTARTPRPPQLTADQRWRVARVIRGGGQPLRSPGTPTLIGPHPRTSSPCLGTRPRT